MITWRYLQTTGCESFSGSNGRSFQRLLKLWDAISRSTAQRPVQGVQSRAEGCDNFLRLFNTPGLRTWSEQVHPSFPHVLTKPDDSRCHLNLQERLPRLFVSTTSRSIVMLSGPTIVTSGTPLLRVVYRDSKFVPQHSLAKKALTTASVRRFFLFRIIW